MPSTMTASGRPIIPFATPSTWSRTQLIQWGVAVVTLIMVAAPLAPILVQSVLDRPLYEHGAKLSLDAYRQLVTEPRMLRVLANTVALAVSTTVIATALGVILAFLIEKTNLPCRRPLRWLLLCPMYISHLVLGIAWFIIYGPTGYATLYFQGDGAPPWNLYTIPGMALAASTAYAPMVFLLCSNALRMSDSSLVDAARSVGSGWVRTTWRIVVPMMRPAIAYSAMLAFIGSIEMLAVPLLFGRSAGIEVLATFLYAEGLGVLTPNYGLIGAVASAMLIVVTLLLVAQNRILRAADRYVSVRGKAQRAKPIRLGWSRWPIMLVIMAYVFAALILPLCGVVLRSVTIFLTPLISPFEVLTTDNFSNLLSDPDQMRAVWNSLFIASVGGALATAFILLATIVIHRSDFALRKQMQFVALYPRAMPGLVVGIGLFWAMMILPLAGHLQGTLWILILGFAMLGLPTGYGAIAPALFQIGGELDQGARSSGADWWATSWRIIIPLLKPAILTAFSLMFISFLKEYSAALFLLAPNNGIIGTNMLQAWGKGDSGAVAALAMIQLIITVLFLGLIRLLARTTHHG